MICDKEKYLVFYKKLILNAINSFDNSIFSIDEKHKFLYKHINANNVTNKVSNNRTLYYRGNIDDLFSFNSNDFSELTSGLKLYFNKPGIQILVPFEMNFYSDNNEYCYTFEKFDKSKTIINFFE